MGGTWISVAGSSSKRRIHWCDLGHKVAAVNPKARGIWSFAEWVHVCGLGASENLLALVSVWVFIIKMMGLCRQVLLVLAMYGFKGWGVCSGLSLNSFKGSHLGHSYYMSHNQEAEIPAKSKAHPLAAKALMCLERGPGASFGLRGPSCSGATIA